MTATHATLLLKLDPPPKVELETLSETRVGEGGFLAIRRTELVTLKDGARSQSFPYDLVDRRAMDAAIMVAHHFEEGRVWVWLRSSVRPPIGLRRGEAPTSSVLWELPAGLIEPGESPRAAAARELAEELGFHVDATAMADLGPPGYPAPGLIGEVHHFFHVEVDPQTRREPEGDGSPVEAGALIVAISLEEAVAAFRRGDLRDEKTELGLRRLVEVLS